MRARHNRNGLSWRIHMPNLLKEIMCNQQLSILAAPLNILGNTLHELAELALEINDPRLHLIMFDLTLYDEADLTKVTRIEYSATRERLMKLCKEQEALKNEKALT